MAKFYHQTKSDRWKEIQREGVLWGRPHFWYGLEDSYRYTYLSPVPFYDDDAFDILLEVEYEPTGIRGIDNFRFNPPEGEYCWQFSVFDPIPLDRVRVVDPVSLPPKEELIAASKKLKPKGSERGSRP